MQNGSSGGATGGVKRLLQLEALAVLLAAVGFYVKLSASWKLFAILFLAPDLAMAFYIFGPLIGAAAYNTTHSTLGPVAVLTTGYLLSRPLVLAVGLIWASHVGFDRALGYGLKYATAFGGTHLGLIGRVARAAA